MPTDKEDAIDDIYTKATRPNPPPKKWRVNPSSAADKKKLVDYTTGLEDVVVYQQDTLTKTWTFLRQLQRNERSPSSISEFLLSLPGVRYRTDTSSAFGSADDRVVEDLDRMATGTE